MANKERIQQLEKIIKSCIEAGVGFNEYKAELDGLRGQAPVSAPINTAALVKQAEANQAQAVAQAQKAQDEVEFEDTIADKGKWAESAKYVLNATGNFRSKLVRYIDPNTDKPQRWFICETEDEQVPEPNCGVLVGEFGRGAGIYHGILDSLNIKYKYNKDNGKLTYHLKLPLYFYADWGSEERAIGGVRISNITLEKPAQAV